MAGALRQLGLRREERILLLMQDTADWPVVFLGALHAGVVPPRARRVRVGRAAAHTAGRAGPVAGRRRTPGGVSAHGPSARRGP
ncbi:hypothetical protein G6F62_015527 [Rhizopus arrhizus]|nr:hypothetical protein G6F62_015527 [Rhizopus arrhizus]